MSGEVGQSTRRIWKLGNKDVRMHQGCDCRVGDVPFERKAVQVRLDSMALQPLAAGSSYKTARERLRPHRERSAPSHLRLKALLASYVTCFVDSVACLVSEEVASHDARLMHVVDSATDNLELDLQSIV